MTIVRAFRFRLYPTPVQAAAMEATANARRYVYNLALEQRRDFRRQAKAKGVTLNFVSQGRELKQLRAECDWIAAAHTTPLTQALRDLDRAFSAFFAGRAKFPRFQSKARHMSFRHKGSELRLGEQDGRWTSIVVPKIGSVALRMTRPVVGQPVSVTFSRDALGWHVCIACEIEHSVYPSVLPAIGVDRGVANTLAFSDGTLASTPDTQSLERRKAKALRVLARRQRGSARYRKQRQRVARVSAKIARIRHDWQHRMSTDVSRRFGRVAIEDLKTSSMTRSGRGKHGLNRSILEQGWRGFETKLAYKLEERGGTLIKVNPAYTSQQCSDCGTIDRASRESQASFACRHCGFRAHADTNAAINILRRSTAVVEGSGCAPVEARTEARAA